MSAPSWDTRQTPRIVFGAGVIRDIGNAVEGRRIVLVTSPGFTRRGLTARIAASLGERLVATVDRVTSNPELADIDAVAADLKSLDADALLAAGGGSAIDFAKALSAALVAPAGWTLRDHFEGRRVLPPGDFLPVFAVATTAGTGAEATPFGTVWDQAARKKYSIADARVVPRVAILDPELTLDLPEDVTVSTGLDAISQAMESVWNRAATEETTAQALEALRLGLAALPRLVDAPRDLALRTDMLSASLRAGLAIAHTRTALAHSMSYPLTSHFGVPHGLACAFTLPAILEFTARHDDGRLLRLAQALGADTIDGLRDVLAGLLKRLHVRARLASYASLDQMLAVAPEMHTPSRADNLMCAADSDDIRAILVRSFELI